MKISYKHTRWLRAAALRVIMVIAILTALPGFVKAEEPGPLNVSNCPGDRDFTLTYKSDGWYYSWKAQPETKFNGTLTGSLESSSYFQIKLGEGVTTNQLTLKMEDANIKTTYDGTFVTFSTTDVSYVFELQNSQLESSGGRFFSVDVPTTIKAVGESASTITGQYCIALSGGNSLVLDGGTAGLNICGLNTYAIQVTSSDNPTLELKGDLTLNRKIFVQYSNCNLKMDEGVRIIAGGVDLYNNAQVTYSAPIPQWSYKTAPAAGTLTVKKGENEEVATFETDGSRKSFAIGAVLNTTYTVWYTPSGGNPVQQMSADGTKEFTLSTNGFREYNTMQDIYDWVFDSDAKTITHMDDGVTINVDNVIMDNTKLVILATPNFSGDVLDLSGKIMDKDGNEFEIQFIGNFAFVDKAFTSVTLPASVTMLLAAAFKGATMGELHLLHESASSLNVGDDALALAAKHACKVYVPKGKLTSGGYYSENTANNWEGFPYIMEEGGKTFTLTYALSPEGTVDDAVEFPDFKPSFIPVGQNFSFKMVYKVEDKGLKLAMGEGATASYQDGIVTISSEAETAQTLTITIVEPIKTPNGEITITGDGTFKEGNGSATDYDNRIGYQSDIILLKSLTFSNTNPVTVSMKDVEVVEGTVFGANTTVTLTIEGEGNVWGEITQILSGASLTLKKKEDAEVGLSYLAFKNYGKLTDETGKIWMLYMESGTDNMFMLDEESSSSPVEYVQSGGKVTLKAGASYEDESVVLTYQWQVWDAENKTWSDVVEPVGLRSTYGTGNTLEVSADDAGKYRCQVTCKVSDTNITTLTYYTSVVLSAPAQTEYIVTLPKVEGATTNLVAGDYYVTEGDWFYFTLTLDKDYDQSKPVVKANGKEIKPDDSGKYWLEYVYENQEIKITGIEKNPAPVGVEGVDASKAKVWTADGSLHIYTPAATNVRIVTVGGANYKDMGIVNGNVQVSLPQGIYILIIGTEATKISM